LVRKGEFGVSYREVAKSLENRGFLEKRQAEDLQNFVNQIQVQDKGTIYPPGSRAMAVGFFVVAAHVVDAKDCLAKWTEVRNTAIATAAHATARDYPERKVKDEEHHILQIEGKPIAVPSHYRTGSKIWVISAPLAKKTGDAKEAIIFIDMPWVTIAVASPPGLELSFTWTTQTFEIFDAANPATSHGKYVQKFELLHERKPPHNPTFGVIPVESKKS
jgi:hypothetical protein